MTKLHRVTGLVVLAGLAGSMAAFAGGCGGDDSGDGSSSSSSSGSTGTSSSGGSSTSSGGSSTSSSGGSSTSSSGGSSTSSSGGSSTSSSGGSSGTPDSGPDASDAGSDATSPEAGTKYTVGVGVTGLTGTGLVLQNNGGDDLTVAANGTVTFGTSLNNGAAYAVTVKTQPAGQTCAVANGSGTIAGANVTNVTVTCAASTFTVGGSVTGLTGGAVVLSINGANDVTVNANGTYASPALPNGTNYTVTVKTQPAGQTCTVTNGTGTIAGANVTNIAVACSAVTYTIGGTITGLTAGSVVLTNNGGNDLTRSANGAFTFTTPVASGSAYAVAVKTQPAGLFCAVTNGSGNASANVTNVAVACSVPTSCKAIKTANPAAASGVYAIRPNATTYNVLCDMTTAGGGWTLAMKGSQLSARFDYASTHWTTASTYAETQTDLDPEDAKFASFNEVPNTNIRIDTDNQFGKGTITVTNPVPNTTLLARFNGPNYEPVVEGRTAWMASQAGTVLQQRCSRGGFNLDDLYVKVRLGFESNQEDDCGTSDSMVGIGVYNSTVCGNTAGGFSAGFESGPGCGPHTPITPIVPGTGADFWVWVR